MSLWPGNLAGGLSLDLPKPHDIFLLLPERTATCFRTIRDFGRNIGIGIALENRFLGTDRSRRSYQDAHLPRTSRYNPIRPAPPSHTSTIKTFLVLAAARHRRANRGSSLPMLEGGAWAKWPIPFAYRSHPGVSPPQGAAGKTRSIEQPGIQAGHWCGRWAPAGRILILDGVGG